MVHQELHAQGLLMAPIGIGALRHALAGVHTGILLWSGASWQKWLEKGLLMVVLV